MKKIWITALLVLLAAGQAWAGTYYVDGSYALPAATFNVSGQVGGAKTTADSNLVLSAKLGGETTDCYNGYGITIVTDPTTEGEGQYRRITAYDVGTNTVTVSSAWSANLSAASTYKITTGNDVAGDGSSGNPYAHIKKALDTAALGAGPHTIYIKPAVYEEVDSAAVDRIICAKATNGPYTFDRWGSTGTVTVTTGGEAADGVLRVGSVQDWTFNNITFVAAKAYTNGVLYVDTTVTTNTIAFNNCVFDGRSFAMGVYGVVYAGGGAAVQKNLTFTNCSLYLDNNTTGGLYGVIEDGGSITWTGCTLYLDHTARKSLFHKNSNQMGTVTIQNCTFDNLNGGAQWSSLIQLMFAGEPAKVFNLIDINGNTDIDRIVDYDDSSLYTECKRCLIRNNTSTDIYGDFVFFQRNFRWLEVTSNTITVEGAAVESQTIRLGTVATPNPGPLGVVRVTNNTIYDSSAGHLSTRGISLDYGVDGAEVVGNKIRVPKGIGIEMRGSYNSVRFNQVRAPFCFRFTGAAVRNTVVNNTGVAVYDGTNASGAVAWLSETTNYPIRNVVRQNVLEAGNGTYCVREWTAGEHYANVIDSNIYWFTGTGSLCVLNSDPDATLADMQAKWATAAYGTWNTGEDPPVGNDQNSVLSDPLLTNPTNGDFSMPGNSPAFATGYPAYLNVGGWVPDARQRYGTIGTTGTHGPE